MSTSTYRDDPSGKFKGNSNGNNPGRFRANQPGTHSLAVRGPDRYPTPRIAVESLLNAEPDVLNTMARVWEPAAGDGNIVHVLRDNGIPGPSLKPIGDSFDPFHRRSPARARIWSSTAATRSL